MRTPLLALLAALVAVPALAAGPAPGLPPFDPDAAGERSAIPDVYKWDLTALYPSEQALTAAMAALDEKIPSLESCRGQLGDPVTLESCLKLYFELHDGINHATLYANLALATAQSDDHLRGLRQQTLALLDRLNSKAGFLRAEILELDEASLERACAARPGLATFRPYLDNLRRRRNRRLSGEGERLLALAGDNLWAEIDLNEIPSAHEKTFGALLADIPWPTVHDEQGRPVQLTLANYPRYRASSSRQVRREAVTAFLGTLRQYQHALAGTLAGQYAFSVFLARARGYDTALEAYLDKDALEPRVYKNLIATVGAHLAPLHRYVRLRKKLLGLDTIHLYDLYVPLLAGTRTRVPFPQARETIIEALAPLGEAYLDVLREGTDPRNGWIDLYPSRDKQSGAFSASAYGTHPYVLMNDQNSVDDMFTLAHEFGHALHSHLAMTHQPYSSFRYAPFLAEIASTCNEALLGDYLIAHAKDRREKAALLVERLEGIRTTIYRQALFAEFEWRVHRLVEQGAPVTATRLEQVYRGLVERYYGPDYRLDPDDGMEWAYIPHFYYKYYVFTYATGLSSGIALARHIVEGGESAADDYLAMLKGGSSAPPLDLLRRAGVDLTTPAPVVAALESFEDAMDELEALLAADD
ncbi:MAG: oligoendopeptidase F [Acidobacteriota bacterium]|nr:oligoendopeptidase F [Acidobacteriota bacterium]